MLDTLLESRAIAERTTTGSAFSFVAHCAIIAGAVLATHQTATAALDPRPETVALFVPREKPPTPVDPPPTVTPVAPTPRGFQILVAPIDIPDVLPPIDLSRPISNPDDYLGRGVPGGRADGDSTVRTPILDRNGTFYEFQVEKPASLLGGSVTPAYPAVLRDAGFEGKVLASFVIDTAGRAEMATLKIMQSDHPMFTDAVRAALPRMRFLPAEVGGKKVKQFAQMPFVFSLK